MPLTGGDESAQSAISPEMMMRKNIGMFLIILTTYAFAASTAHAWSSHCNLTRVIFQKDASLDRRLRAETLGSFLELERDGIRNLLQNEEEWFVKNIPGYPPVPAALRFVGTGPARDLTAAFSRAIRINPGFACPLYLQTPSGSVKIAKRVMPVGRVSLVTADIAQPPLFALSAGDTATAREVLETASEEPDFGMDVGLFADNKTTFGAEYGFGTQPFGNPELDYGTQAPFHMAFFHENFIIKLAAPFSKISHVEYRIRLYTALASFAFKTGHDYWGYRFAGWALHYIQDMAVPYHARMTPGIGTLRLIWANLFYSEEKRNGLLNILSNRHLVFEKYQYYALIDLMGRKAHDNLLLSALAGTSADANAGSYTDRYAREVVSRASYDIADDIDDLMGDSFPLKYVSDPAYLFGVTEPEIDVYAFLKRENPAAAQKMDNAMAPIFKRLGTASRLYIKSLAD